MYIGKEVIGNGTFGEVFRANSLEDSRFHSLKRIYFDIDAEEEFMPIFPEIEALKKCKHENIVKLESFWIEEFDISQYRNKESDLLNLNKK
jgi:serine/threonine protein kinase